MPKDPSLSRVLVLGSGPIIIGQAAEFDYSGSQACRALQEEGVEVILINPNPATIMTDLETADRVYLEPLRPEFVAAVIEKERPARAPPHPRVDRPGLTWPWSFTASGILDQVRRALARYFSRDHLPGRGPGNVQRYYDCHRRTGAGKLHGYHTVRS
ncbi:MAG: hypothetical protein ACOX2T_02715 [bacterium]